MKKIVTDVAIIGAGAAGIPAAITAAGLNVRVDIFDQAAKSGGGCDGGNGVFAVESEMQKERQLPYTKKEIYDFWMDYTHNLVDGRLVAEYINRSAGTVKWLEDFGVEFNDLVAYFQGAYFVWHMRRDGSPVICDLLKEESIKRGVKYHLNTEVYKLDMEKGVCTGFYAKDLNGEIKVEAGAVIIASGGVGKRADFVLEHTGHELGGEISMFPGMLYEGKENLPKLGVELAWEAGAKKTDFMIDAYASIPAPNFGPGGCPPQLGAFRQPNNMMVNVHGERFVNEETMKNGAFMGNAIDLQKDHTGFMIFDSNLKKHYDTVGWEYVMSKPHMFDDLTDEEYIHMNNERGNFDIIKVNSLEEICEIMGISKKLIETVREYNQSIDKFRHDPVFFKNPKYLFPLRGPIYYCARFKRHAYAVLGGLQINYRGEVQTQERDGIPGLYAAGNDANTIYGNTYPFTLSGNSSGFAINSGRIAGEHAVKYIKSQRQSENK